MSNPLTNSRTMKKCIFFLLAILSLTSCEDIEGNDPALQANIDNTFYSSNDTRGSVNGDGSLTIQGFTQQETLTLQLSRLAVGDFRIGEETSNYAIFENFVGDVYTTRPNGQGIINISEVNETDKTITGTFNFNAFLPGIDTIYVSKGVLYNVSYVSGEISDPNNAGTFSANVDGNPFTPTTVTASNNDGTIFISATGVNSSMLISVPSDVEPEIYQIPRTGFNAKYQGPNGPETTQSGNILIIEHNTTDKTIKGAFSFGTNRSEITMGDFNVAY